MDASTRLEILRLKSAGGLGTRLRKPDDKKGTKSTFAKGAKMGHGTYA